MLYFRRLLPISLKQWIMYACSCLYFYTNSIEECHPKTLPIHFFFTCFSKTQPFCITYLGSKVVGKKMKSYSSMFSFILYFCCLINLLFLWVMTAIFLKLLHLLNISIPNVENFLRSTDISLFYLFSILPVNLIHCIC